MFILLLIYRFILQGQCVFFPGWQMPFAAGTPLLILDKSQHFKLDMAAKKRKKHKNKISGLVISMCYDE
jgi:hypothetical protein